MDYVRLSGGSIIGLSEVCAVLQEDGQYYLFLESTSAVFPIPQKDVLTISEWVQDAWNGKGYTVMPDTGLVVLKHINAVFVIEDEDDEEKEYVLSLKGKEHRPQLTEADYQHLERVLYSSAQLYTRPK